MQGNKLFVGNLSFSTTEHELTELFSQHGTVQSVRIIPNKGFGFVEMSNSNEAENAKNALNLASFGGRNLNVNEARPQRTEPRHNSGSFERY